MRRQLGRFGIPATCAAVVVCYVEWVIRHRYDDIAPMNVISRIGCPVLLVHGKADDIVPMTDALAIRDNCGAASLELLLIDGAGHNSVNMIERHGDQLVNFLRRANVLA
jgi:alpha-beta hydrolase superfamily lysophospholipase